MQECVLESPSLRRHHQSRDMTGGYRGRTPGTGDRLNPKGQPSVVAVEGRVRWTGGRGLVRVWISPSLNRGVSEHEMSKSTQCIQSRWHALCRELHMPYHLCTPKPPADWALQVRGVKAFKVWLHLRAKVSVSALHRPGSRRHTSRCWPGGGTPRLSWPSSGCCTV